MTLKAVVMAGGKGTRLRPITYSIPKPLVPIAGKPCINYILGSYYEAGIRDTIITAGYKFESLINGVLNYKNSDQNILFSVEKEPAGTAGSIKMISKFIDDTFVVGSGDTLLDFNVREIIDSHKKSKAKITIALTEVDDPSQFGIVELKGGVIQRFLEKPTKEETFSNLINAGLYVMEPEILDMIPSSEPYDFAKQLFPKLLAEGVQIHGFNATGTWLDTGRPNDMIKANQLMTEKYGTPHSSEMMSGKIIMASPSSSAKGAKIIGPTYIGKAVKFYDSSKIDSSAIYDNVEIGEGVVIMDSILMDDVKIGKNSRIVKSVIMKGTSIGQNCEIHESVIAPKLSLQSNSRVYNVSLSSEIIEEER